MITLSLLNLLLLVPSSIGSGGELLDFILRSLKVMIHLYHICKEPLVKTPHQIIKRRVKKHQTIKLIAPLIHQLTMIGITLRTRKMIFQKIMMTP